MMQPILPIPLAAALAAGAVAAAARHLVRDSRTDAPQMKNRLSGAEGSGQPESSAPRKKNKPDEAEGSGPSESSAPRRGNSFLSGEGAEARVSYAPRRGMLRVGIPRFMRILGIVAFAFLLNLRIQRPVPDRDAEFRNIDVLFVLDDTLSMYAKDGRDGKTRMADAVSDCQHIISRLGGESFGLIKFDNQSLILAPFTQDADNVNDAFLAVQQPDSYYAQGTSLNVPYEDMEELLLSSSKKEDRKCFVFFLSDGEITDGTSLSSYAALARYVDGGAVLGYGTAAGGKMTDGYGYPIRDPETYAEAVSRIDETSLRQLASDLGVDYIAQTQQSNVDAELRMIEASAESIRGNGRTVIYEDTYYYFAVPLFLLLVWELVLLIRERRL